MPEDIKLKHKNTLKKVDNMLLSKYKNEAITSEDKEFDLNYYIKLVKLGIRLDLSQNDPLAKEIDELAKDISMELFDKTTTNIKQNEIMPTLKSDKKEKSQVKISLNGSGYDVQEAVNYAYDWTDPDQELRNSNYDYYDGMNDCTNFASQVLYEGGGLSQVHTDTSGYDFEENTIYTNTFHKNEDLDWFCIKNSLGCTKRIQIKVNSYSFHIDPTISIYKDNILLAEIDNSPSKAEETFDFTLDKTASYFLCIKNVVNFESSGKYEISYEEVIK